MKLIVDAMGGDHAPGEIVKGACMAAREFGVEVILVGREADIRAHWQEDPRVSIVRRRAGGHDGGRPVYRDARKAKRIDDHRPAPARGGERRRGGVRRKHWGAN